MEHDAIDLKALGARRVREAWELAREWVRSEGTWRLGVESPTGAVDEMGLSCDPKGDAVGLGLIGALRRACGDDGTYRDALALVGGMGPGLDQAVLRARTWERMAKTHAEVMAGADMAVAAARRASPAPEVRRRSHGLRLVAAALQLEWEALEASKGVMFPPAAKDGEDAPEDSEALPLPPCTEIELEYWRAGSRTLSDALDGAWLPATQEDLDEGIARIEADARRLEEETVRLHGELPPDIDASSALRLTAGDVLKLAGERRIGPLQCRFDGESVFLELSDGDVDDALPQAVVIHVPEGVSLPPVRVISRRRAPASLIVTGPGEANAMVAGAGDGDVRRLGGKGNAIRTGQGAGNAVNDGPGPAERHGEGMGDAVSLGGGDACRTGPGVGGAHCRAGGRSVRKGPSRLAIGDATVIGDGHAERRGLGVGDAHASRGGTCAHDGRSAGSAYGPARKPSPQGKSPAP